MNLPIVPSYGYSKITRNRTKTKSCGTIKIDLFILIIEKKTNNNVSI